MAKPPAAKAVPATGDDSAAPPPKSRRKLLMIVAAVLVVAAGGGAAAMWLMPGAKPAATAGTAAAAASAKAAEPVAGRLVDVPPMLINIRTNGRAPQFMKLHFMLVGKQADSVEPIKAAIPAVIDRFQPLLRELRAEDLEGSTGIYRVKEELLIRADAAIGGDHIDDVLIQEMLIQ